MQMPLPSRLYRISEVTVSQGMNLKTLLAAAVALLAGLVAAYCVLPLSDERGAADKPAPAAAPEIPSSAASPVAAPPAKAAFAAADLSAAQLRDSFTLVLDSDNPDKLVPLEHLSAQLRSAKGLASEQKFAIVLELAKKYRNNPFVVSYFFDSVRDLKPLPAPAALRETIFAPEFRAEDRVRLLGAVRDAFSNQPGPDQSRNNTEVLNVLRQAAREPAEPLARYATVELARLTDDQEARTLLEGAHQRGLLADQDYVRELIHLLTRVTVPEQQALLLQTAIRVARQSVDPRAKEQLQASLRALQSSPASTDGLVPEVKKLAAEFLGPAPR